MNKVRTAIRSFWKEKLIRTAVSMTSKAPDTTVIQINIWYSMSRAWISQKYYIQFTGYLRKIQWNLNVLCMIQQGQPLCLITACIYLEGRSKHTEASISIVSVLLGLFIFKSPGNVSGSFLTADLLPFEVLWLLSYWKNITLAMKLSQ
jgi:hypothetical protein